MDSKVVDLQNSTAYSNIGKPGSGANLGKTEFLNLLMAQMSNQDPMNPMDNEGFIQQLTQFANLEQLKNVSGQFDDLLRITSASNSANAVSLLGKEVRLNINQLKGPEAKVYYDLPENAKDVVLEVRDLKGKVIKSFGDMEAGKGLHQVEIKDLKEGEYTFNVVAKDAKGSEIKANLSVLEYVDGVNFSQAIPTILTSSGREISAAEVIEIRSSGGKSPSVSSQEQVNADLPEVVDSGADELPKIEG